MRREVAVDARNARFLGCSRRIAGSRREDTTMKRIDSASIFGSSGLRARLVSIWRNSILALAAGSLGLLSTPMLAQGFQGDYQGCAADRPCFNAAHQEGNKVVFNFTGVTGWDFYNVRYKAVGGGEKQVENRSGHFTL